jgi:hypothetical protein
MTHLEASNDSGRAKLEPQKLLFINFIADIVHTFFNEYYFYSLRHFLSNYLRLIIGSNLQLG